MAVTLTTKFGLRKPDNAEIVDVLADIDANWDLIDTTMGDRSCTSTTRPSVAYIGLHVFETDTKAVVVCTGVGPIVWRYVTQPTVASAAARNALTPVYTGMTVSRSDTLNIEMWNGTSWFDTRVYPSYPLGMVNESILTANSTSFALGEVVVWQLGFTSLGTSRRYRFEFDGCVATSVGTPTGPNLQMAFRWRTGLGTVVPTDAAVWVRSPSCLGAGAVNPIRTGNSLTGLPAGSIQIGIGCSCTNSVTASMVAGGANMRSFRIYDEGQ